MQASQNRILPQGGSFQAVVNGKPTGLAGCTQSGECPKAANCLRADAQLIIRFAMTDGPLMQCERFISN